jgi:hypothetical protein
MESWNTLCTQIGHHGAELNNAWFMRNGSSVVEVRMKDFKGIWPDTYFRSLFRTENAILYWQAAVVKDGTWKPSRFERAQETRKQAGMLWLTPPAPCATESA